MNYNIEKRPKIIDKIKIHKYNFWTMNYRRLYFNKVNNEAKKYVEEHPELYQQFLDCVRNEKRLL